MVHLKSITLKKREQEVDGFPFHVPVMRDLQEVQFTAPVTFSWGKTDRENPHYSRQLPVPWGQLRWEVKASKRINPSSK